MQFLWRKKLKITRSSFSAAIPKVAVTEKERLHFYPNRHIKAQNSVSWYKKKTPQRFSVLVRLRERSQPARRWNERMASPLRMRIRFFIFYFRGGFPALHPFLFSQCQRATAHTQARCETVPTPSPQCCCRGPPSLTNSCNESRGRRAEKHGPSHRTLL